MNTFDHERLDVYQVAIDFVAFADDVVERLPSFRDSGGASTLIRPRVPPQDCVDAHTPRQTGDKIGNGNVYGLVTGAAYSPCA